MSYPHKPSLATTIEALLGLNLTGPKLQFFTRYISDDFSTTVSARC